MKPVISLGAILTAIALFSGSTYAQEQQDCFMLDSNGHPVDLGGLCGGGSNGPSSFQSSPGSSVIPIKRRLGNIPVIDVTFGRRSFEMLLDTGASATVLTQEMAKALNVVAEGAALVSTASENEVPFPIGRVDSIAVGNVIKNDLPVYIAPTLEMGLLGQNFFGGFDMTIRENVIELKKR